MGFSLYLMRHCEPVPGHPNNAERALTEDGLKQAADMGAWLAGHIGRVDIVITSPFMRAVQTAQAMGKALGAHLADTRMLQPDGNPDDMWKEIERLAQQSKDVLVVGHDPSLNALIGWLQGFDPNHEQEPLGPAELRLEWGSVASMTVKTTSGGGTAGTLQWLVTPLIVLAQKEIVEAARELVGILDAD